MTLARVEKSTFQSELQHSNNFLNLLTPKSDWQLISPYHITPESNINKGQENKGNDHLWIKFLIVRQILFVITIGSFIELYKEYEYWC